MKTWKEIIDALVDAGMTQTDIAKEIDLTPQTVNDLLGGRQKSMKYVPGAALMALYNRKCARRKS